MYQQKDFFRSDIDSDWYPPAFLPRWWEAKRVSIDVETHDPDLTTKGPSWARGGGKIVGVGFAVDGEPPIYVPFAHGNGKADYGNLCPRTSLRWIRDIAESSADKVVFNATYEMGWLRETGIDLRGKILDASIASTLLDENRRSGNYSLNSFSRDWLGLEKDESLLRAAADAYGVDPKSGLWKLHSKFVGPYGEQDAALNLRLWDHCKNRLVEQGLMGAYELEASLIPILVEMRYRGVRVDLDAGERLLHLIESESRNVRAKFKTQHGINLPPERSNDEIASAADRLGLEYPKTPLGNASFSKQWLSAQEHPLFAGIQELRSCSTIKSLVSSQISNAVNGRIHCSLHPLKTDEGGTVTFRFSSSNPNLQQVPARGRWGKLVRSLYLPEEGESWVKADYSQQEYRLIVHYASLTKCKGSAKAVESYNRDGADYHKMTMEWMDWPMDAEHRNRAKILNFGMAYAMEKTGVASQLGCSKEEAGDVLAEYHQRVPFVKELSDFVSREAMRRGFIRLMFGHVCHFDLWQPARFEARDSEPLKREEAEKKWPRVRLQRAHGRLALNKLIQGSGAGMIKKAMIDLYSEGIVGIIQVHDELDFSVPSSSQTERIKEIMHGVTSDMQVPVPVDADQGRSWAVDSFDQIIEKEGR